MRIIVFFLLPLGGFTQSQHSNPIEFKILSIQKDIGFEFKKELPDSIYFENSLIFERAYNLSDTFFVYNILIEDIRNHERFILLSEIKKESESTRLTSEKLQVGHHYELNMFRALGPAPLTVNCLGYYSLTYCKNDTIKEIYRTENLDGLYLIK